MGKKEDGKSIKESIVTALENRILSGEYLPGDKLPPERDLALELNVSRAIVSMCIQELEQNGFVKVVPRHGAYVLDYLNEGGPKVLSALMHYDCDKVPEALIVGIMETRTMIQLECTKKAIERASDEDFEQLSNALDNMDLFAEENADNMFFHYNYKFHHTLAVISGNPLNAMIIKSFEDTIIFFVSRYYYSPERRKTGVKLHKKLLNAMKSRDETLAINIFKEMLAAGTTGLVALS